MSGGAGAAEARPAIPLLNSLIVVVAALAAMAPELVFGISPSDSMRYDHAWVEQFGALFRAGDLYPRWLPQAWDGLGSPTFYFYPPLYFWISSAVGALTLGALPTETIVALATLLVLAASGIGMRKWLERAASPRAATLGAVLYVLAPYHLFDIYQRGALAEACGYAAIPPLMLALARIGEGKAGYALVVAASYAALLFSHLPFALLASVTLIPAFALYTAWRSASPLRTALLSAAGGAGGLALAAIYWLPALQLTPFVSYPAAFVPFFRPESWFFWKAAPEPQVMRFVLASCAMALVLAAAAFRRRSEAAFWCGGTLALVLLIAGLVPGFWSLPRLADVQFPWRLLPLVEFAVITALATAGASLRRPFVLAALLPAVVAYAMVGRAVLAGAAEGARARTLHEIALLAREHRDAPEYLPPGFAIPTVENGIPEASMVPLPAIPEASADGAGVSAAGATNGALNVEVQAAAPVRVVARRFSFPHWRVTDEAGREVATAPHGPSRLLSWQAPAGQSRYAVTAGRAPGERAALAISLTALLLIIGASAALARRRWRHRRVNALVTISG